MNRPSYLPYLGIAALAAVGAALIHFQTAANVDAALRVYRQESAAEAHDLARTVENQFAEMQQQLRTIARLPGIRSVDRHGTNLTVDAHATVQEIYNNLRSNVAVSEVYIVPADFSPDEIDPVTEKTEAPILSFDELIVGRTLGKGGAATATDAATDDDHDGAANGKKIPEIEIFEYRAIAKQIAALRAAHPTLASIDFEHYPATSSPEVITCDNTRYSPEHPDDKDRSGLVYSVPFYDEAGAFKGVVSAVFLTQVLRNMLPAGDHRLLQSKQSYEVAAAGAPATTQSAALFSQVLPLQIADLAGHWQLAVARADGDFAARPEVVAARRGELLGYAILALLAIVLVWVQRMAAERRRAAAGANAELEQRVAERTSQLHGTLEQLTAAKRSAEQASHSKSEFLARMSHELRTPLNGVLGMTEILRGTTLDPRQRQLSDIVYSSAESLVEVINRILDFSRIEAKRIDLDAQPFELRPMIEECIDAFAEPAHRRKLDLLLELDASLPSEVKGDAMRLRQVLAHVVENAVKFTEQGGVHITVRSLTTEGSAAVVEFKVRDSGVGIGKEALATVFDAFSQGEGYKNRRFGGTGLGLAIARHLVGLMDGDIQIASEQGSGTTVTFTVQLRVLSQQSADPLPDLTGVKVLVVEDGNASRDVLVRMLAAVGAVVVPASTAKAALAAVGGCDALIVDADLPDSGGGELARRFKKEGATEKLPLILLSGVEAGKLGASAAARYADAVISKPVHQSALIGTLARLLNRTVVLRMPAGAVAAAVPADDGPLGMCVLVVEDNPVNIEVATRMLEVLGCVPLVAHDGQEALDIWTPQGFDLILMDCQMPVLDGYAATVEIRRREASKAGSRRVPILALSANVSDEDIENCMRSGMDDCIAKPFTKAQLEAALRKWRHRGRATQKQSSGPVTEDVGGVVLTLPATVLDDSAISRIRGGGESGLLESMISGYRRDSIAALVALRMSIGCADIDALRSALRSLQVSSAALGGHRFVALCGVADSQLDAGGVAAVARLLEMLTAEHRLLLKSLARATRGKVSMTPTTPALAAQAQR